MGERWKGKISAPKSLEDYFIDWESHVFGFGYGTGEEPVMGALKTFMALLEDGRSYDYKKVEAALGATAAWLLINTLCHEDLVEYGVSPRFGWLTRKGEKLKSFLDTLDLAAILDLLSYDQDHAICMPDACNCGPNGYDAEAVCPNPFWWPDNLPLPDPPASQVEGGHG